MPLLEPRDTLGTGYCTLIALRPLSTKPLPIARISMQD